MGVRAGWLNFQQSANRALPEQFPRTRLIHPSGSKDSEDG